VASSPTATHSADDGQLMANRLMVVLLTAGGVDQKSVVVRA
jgi:hypothetical protein